MGVRLLLHFSPDASLPVAGNNSIQQEYGAVVVVVPVTSTSSVLLLLELHWLLELYERRAICHLQVLTCLVQLLLRCRHYLLLAIDGVGHCLQGTLCCCVGAGEILHQLLADGILPMFLL